MDDKYNKKERREEVESLEEETGEFIGDEGGNSCDEGGEETVGEDGVGSATTRQGV